MGLSGLPACLVDTPLPLYPPTNTPTAMVLPSLSQEAPLRAADAALASIRPPPIHLPTRCYELLPSIGGCRARSGRCGLPTLTLTHLLPRSLSQEAVVRAADAVVAAIDQAALAIFLAQKCGEEGPGAAARKKGGPGLVGRAGAEQRCRQGTGLVDRSCRQHCSMRHF